MQNIYECAHETGVGLRDANVRREATDLMLFVNVLKWEA
jgi:hypothetical protein